MTLTFALPIGQSPILGHALNPKAPYPQVSQRRSFLGIQGIQSRQEHSQRKIAEIAGA